MNVGTRVARAGVHLVLRNRNWLKAQLTTFAAEHELRRVMEIGSGKPEGGEYVYSMRPLFPEVDEFVMTDLNPEFGHQVVDVTTFEVDEPFDAILCLSVLEHVPEPKLALQRLHDAVRPGGTVVIGVPFAYPLHDEPADFWRFTEHGLRLLMEPLFDVELHHRGPRQFPSGLLAYGVRRTDEG